MRLSGKPSLKSCNNVPSVCVDCNDECCISIAGALMVLIAEDLWELFNIDKISGKKCDLVVAFRESFSRRINVIVAEFKYELNDHTLVEAIRQLEGCVELVTRIFKIGREDITRVVVVHYKRANLSRLSKLALRRVVHGLKLKYCYECSVIDDSFSNIRHFDIDLFSFAKG